MDFICLSCGCASFTCAAYACGGCSVHHVTLPHPRSSHAPRQLAVQSFFCAQLRCGCLCLLLLLLICLLPFGFWQINEAPTRCNFPPAPSRTLLLSIPLPPAPLLLRFLFRMRLLARQVISKTCNFNFVASPFAVVVLCGTSRMQHRFLPAAAREGAEEGQGVG